jgi:hypothetical protein
VCQLRPGEHSRGRLARPALTGISQGYFAAADGAWACTPCRLGLFGPNESSTSCLSCQPPVFFTQAAAARQCSSCNAGLYAVYDNVSAGVFRECRFCPEGASCAALSDVAISPRYYAVRDPATLAVETFLCDGRRCAANFACGTGRLPAEDNPLCGQCLPGHSEWDGACVACPGVNGGLVFGLLLLAWACVLVIHGFAQRGSTGSALRIAMFFWQVSFLIVGGAAWARWAAFLELNFFTASSGSGSVCPFPVSPHGALVLQLLGPLLPYALLAATAGLHRGLGCVWIPAGLPRFEPASYWRTLISLYFFTFNSVARACLDFFNCASLPSGRYLVALPAVRCDEAAYRGLMPLVVLLLAAYAVVVPAVIVVRLREAHGLRSADESDVERVWSVTYGPLRSGVFWWSMAQTLARAMLVATAVYLRANGYARNAAFALLCVIAALAASSLKPNSSASDNLWELATLSSLVLLALSEIMGAPDAWLALVTLGVGAAVALRLAADGLRRLSQRGAPASHDSDLLTGEPSSASSYVALEGDRL